MSTDTPRSPGGKSPGDPEEKAAAGSSSSVGQTTPSSGAKANKPSAGASQQSGQAEKTAEEIRERAREVQDRIEEGYHELEQRYDDARMQLRQANDTAVSFIRENPVMCLVGAVGVGYFVGRLASRRWLT